MFNSIFSKFNSFRFDKRNLTTIAKVLAPILILLSFSMVVEAQTNTTPSVGNFRDYRVDVYDTITFNYTTISGVPMMKTIKSHVIISNKSMAESVNTFGLTDRIDFGARVSNIYNQNEYQILTTSQFNYNTANFSYVGTAENFSSYEYRFNDFKYSNYSDNSALTHSGSKFFAILPDPNSVMYDWCRKNNAVPGTITNRSYTMDYQNVDFLALSFSQPLAEPDTNLDDGYQALNASASASGLAWAVVGIIALVVVFVGIGLMTGLATGNLIPDPADAPDTYIYENTTVVYNLPQTNQSEQWETYKAIVGEENATKEGFIKYLEDYYGAQGTAFPEEPVKHTYNINQTSNSGQQRNSMFSMITGFIEDIIPFIVGIVILVVIIVVVVTIIRVFRGRRRS